MQDQLPPESPSPRAASSHGAIFAAVAAGGLLVIAAGGFFAWKALAGRVSVASDGAARGTLEGLVGGPAPEAELGPGAQAAPNGLSANDIGGTVEKNRKVVRQRCWEPALDGRTAKGPSNARVSVKLVIDPSGNVQSASTSDADAFPGLSDCINRTVKQWTFPAAGGPSTVSVPFVFASQ